MSRRCDPRVLRAACRQRGSAYVVVLMALVVLTAIGLGTSLITQTEMQIGANEKTLQRVFYAADAGLASSTARALVAADYVAKIYEMDDPDATAGLDVRHEVDASPFFPILDSPCNLCEINNAGTYEDRAYRRINNAITVRARRLIGTTGLRQSEKTLTSMIEVQPWRASTEAYLPLDDPEQLKKIKF